MGPFRFLSCCNVTRRRGPGGADAMCRVCPSASVDGQGFGAIFAVGIRCPAMYGEIAPDRHLLLDPMESLVPTWASNDQSLITLE